VIQLNWLQEENQDYSNDKVLIGLSGGINSAAVLCYLGELHPDQNRPKELHLYYAHFTEHSPDTFRFVKDCIHYARARFSNVSVRITRNSVLDFFKQEGMIPHPTLSPCSIELKIKPMYAYAEQHGIKRQLVGYVRHEQKRIKRQVKKDKSGFSQYPIAHWTDDDCLAFVKDKLGWYPAIYDIKERGQRVFTHNNCLPCKNMTTIQIETTRRHFPAFLEKADVLAEKIGAYWGRDDTPKVFQCDNCERLFN